MRPSEEDLAKAVVTMAEVIPFFPQSDTAKEIVLASLRSFVGEKQGLDWLVATACRVITKKVGFSIAELRGLYCTRWSPIDALPESESTIPGFTPGEAMDQAERAYLLREAAETDRKMLAWKAEQHKLIEAAAFEEPLLIKGLVEPAALKIEPAERHPPRWLRDMTAPNRRTAEEEIDLRPLKQVEQEIAAAPRVRRTAEENRHLREELERAIGEGWTAGEKFDELRKQRAGGPWPSGGAVLTP